MIDANEMSQAEIGERLRVERENSGKTQAEVARAMEMARTTLVAIEQGHRKIRINELQRLANLFGTSVNALVRRESIHVDLAPRFRKLAGSTAKTERDAAQLLTDLAVAEVELENLLGVKKIRNLPPERLIAPGDVRAQAEDDAMDLRQRLGIGWSPISDIVTLLEMEMGVRVYVRRLDSRISGLFAFDEILGPCMLLNASHPRGRRNQTACHEFGHLITTRLEPEILHQNDSENTREEKYAAAFGRAFVTPRRAVAQKFAEVTAGSGELTRRHVIVLAHYFHVSREAIVRRLEELTLVKSGAWDWFQAHGGITDQQASLVLGDLAGLDVQQAEAARPTTLRLNLIAAAVIRQGLMSEGQVSRLLHLDRIELRSILDGVESEEGEVDETFPIG